MISFSSLESGVATEEPSVLFRSESTRLEMGAAVASAGVDPVVPPTAAAAAVAGRRLRLFSSTGGEEEEAAAVESGRLAGPLGIPSGFYHLFGKLHGA